MVKIPNDHEKSTDRVQIEARTQFLHDTGVLIHMWNRVELFIELAIFRLTNLEPLHASIILGCLQHKAKVSILYSLLRLRDENEAISKLKTALSYAKRNALVHSALASDDTIDRIVFHARAVDDRYRVSSHEFTSETFHAHVWRFCELAHAALLAIGLDEEDPETQKALNDYGRAAGFKGIDACLSDDFSSVEKSPK